MGQPGVSCNYLEYRYQWDRDEDKSINKFHFEHPLLRRAVCVFRLRAARILRDFVMQRYCEFMRGLPAYI